MPPVEVLPGDGPVVLGMPHTATWLPTDVLAELNDKGREIADTDWHIHRLYEELLPEATTVRALFHRYLIDANRDPSGVSLYPGQNTTGLVPLTDFDGSDIWDTPPDAAKIEARRQAYHAPYHVALEAELKRAHDRHGFAVLFDCHSIRSNIPFLFDGTLPDFNIGDNNGTTCAPEITRAAEVVCQNAEGYSSVTNGRFKGGWTTRHYGRPQEGLHAIQLELAQSTYMQESPPWDYDARRAANTQIHLKEMLGHIDTLAREGGLK